MLACSLQAQNLDSLSASNLKYDSILSSDENSMPTLFYKHQNDVLINNLGPYGSPFYYPTTQYLYKKELLTSDPFNNQLLKLHGIKPYTNITYINASRKEQLFSIQHFQQFGKLMLLNFDFKKISSPGAYVNQEANNTTFAGAFKFHTRKDNYELKFSTGIFRNFYDENGGLYDLKDYENSVYDNERTYPVNLENSNSFIKKYENQINQRLDLFKLSSEENNKTIYLKHQLKYTTKQRVFYDNDPLSKIYANIYLDSIFSVDSIYTNNLSNCLNIGFRTSNYSFELFGQYDQMQYVQNAFVNSNYHTSYLGFETSLQKKELTIDAIAKYGLDGFCKGEIESDIAIVYDKTKYNIGGGVRYFLNGSDVNYNYYISNHFIWTNEDFEKQSILNFHLNLKLKKLQLEFLAENKILTNTFYFDSLALASQDKNTITISTFSLAKDYRLLNFHFRTAAIYQLTSNQYLFPLPEIIGRQVLYYQKYIFKGALKFQFGVGVSYSTEYYGYAYMPALTEFYVQQKTKFGYYPQVDVFINTHLKRAQIFLKYEHFNVGKSLHKSNAVPSYPPMNKSLKFGVSWNLFD